MLTYICMCDTAQRSARLLLQCSSSSTMFCSFCLVSPQRPNNGNVKCRQEAAAPPPPATPPPLPLGHQSGPFIDHWLSFDSFRFDSIRWVVLGLHSPGLSAFPFAQRRLPMATPFGGMSSFFFCILLNRHVGHVCWPARSQLPSSATYRSCASLCALPCICICICGHLHLCL